MQMLTIFSPPVHSQFMLLEPLYALRVLCSHGLYGHLLHDLCRVHNIQTAIRLNIIGDFTLPQTAPGLNPSYPNVTQFGYVPTP